MLNIDKGRRPPHLLCVGDRRQRQRRLARRFRPEDLHNPASWETPRAQGLVDRKTAGGDDRDLQLRRRIAQPHDRILAIRFDDRLQGQI